MNEKKFDEKKKGDKKPVEKFEDLIAWQKARVLTKQIYLATRQGAFAKDFGLSSKFSGHRFQ